MQTEVHTPGLFDVLTVAVVDVGMQLQALGNLGGETSSQFQTLSGQVVMEGGLVDLDIVVARELAHGRRFHVGLHEPTRLQGNSPADLCPHLAQ